LAHFAPVPRNKCTADALALPKGNQLLKEALLGGGGLGGAGRQHDGHEGGIDSLEPEPQAETVGDAVEDTVSLLEFGGKRRLKKGSTKKPKKVGTKFRISKF
jgi:hypothetical protein